jgi:hypothetical protein
MKAKNPIVTKKKDNTLKIKGTFLDVLKASVSGNPKPVVKRPTKKK